MVAPEPGEPLLLYIAATAEVMSMMLVAERLEPQQSQVPKEGSAGGSRSQDSDLAEEPGDKEVVGSQLSEPSQAPKPQVGSQPSEPTPGLVGHTTAGSQLQEVTSGPEDQEATGSQLSEAISDLGSQESPGPEPMEVDASDPPPLESLEHLAPGVLYQQGPPRC
jgi:hypothetical protein